MKIDPFDTLLNSRCSIWKKGGVGVVDSHGFENQEYTLLLEGVKTKVQPEAGKELDTDAAFGIQNYIFVMRPQTVDDPPRLLNIHDWLQVNSYTDFYGREHVLIDPPDPTGIMYDIVNIKNPGQLDHHLEISAKLIEP